MPLVWVPEADNSQIFASRACTYDETTSKSEIQKDLKRARNEEVEAHEEEVEAHEEKLEARPRKMREGRGEAREEEEVEAHEEKYQKFEAYARRMREAREEAPDCGHGRSAAAQQPLSSDGGASTPVQLEAHAPVFPRGRIDTLENAIRSDLRYRSATENKF